MDTAAPEVVRRLCDAVLAEAREVARLIDRRIESACRLAGGAAAPGSSLVSDALAEAPSRRQMKLLIADDHPGLCLNLAEQIRLWGYEPSVTHDGRAALETLLAPGGPRLALLDWLMPGLDGIDVCRRLRAEPEGEYAYLVLMTGQGGREPMLDGLRAGRTTSWPSRPTRPN